MRVENAFEVAQPGDIVWELLMDVPQVITCVPGATLLDALGQDRWKAELRVQLGPMSMVFDSDVTRTKANRADGEVLLLVRARERSGRGGASAEIRSELKAVRDGTRVTVETDMRLQGTVARVGRGEIVEDVSQQMIDAFATCLKGRLTHDPALSYAPARPSLIRMALKAVWARVRRVFRVHD
jgi:carbon monoxide dehydrogenase subunit G